MSRSTWTHFQSRPQSRWFWLLSLLLLTASLSGCGDSGSGSGSGNGGGSSNNGQVALAVVQPNNGPAAGGNTVTLYGANFVGVTAVTFGGVPATGVTVTSISSSGASQLTCAVPTAQPPGAKAVTITTSKNGSATLANGYTYNAPPTIGTITPNNGPTTGGTQLFITGTNLTSDVTVTIGGVPATMVFFNSTGTEITVISPAGSAGAKDVVISAPSSGSSTLTGGFTYNAAATITSIAPTTGGQLGGTAVVITGTNFVAGEVVTFGGVPASNVNVASSTQITCLSPPSSIVGSVTVIARADANGTATSPTPFTYTAGAAPTVSFVSPPSGPQSGGQSILVAGANFGPAVTVTIGGVACQGAIVNAQQNQVTCTTGSTTLTGAQTVVVNSPTNGVGSLANGYTYLAAPTLTSASPNSGPLAGGNTVVLTGTNLGGTITASFGNSPALVLSSNGSTTVSVQAPSSSVTGAVTPTISSSTNGIASLSGGYTYNALPTVTATFPSPFSGPVAGGTAVTLVGTGFIGTVNVTVGTIPVGTVTVTGGTTITFLTPPAVSAGAATITVGASGSGSVTVSPQFTYVPGPTIISVVPNVGPTAGGTGVVITGTGFQGVSSVLIGNAATGVAVTGTTTINCTTSSATAAGAVNVSVATSNGTVTAPGAFTYTNSATITSVTPSSGPQGGGTQVTFVGANLFGMTSATLGTAALTNVSVSFDGSTLIGTTTASSTSGLVSATVVTPTAGTAVLSNAFTFNATPVITSVTPGRGPQQGGTVVTVAGTNFGSVSQVTFGMDPGVVTNVSNTQVIVTTPAVLSPGTVSVTLFSSTNGTVVFSTPGFIFDPAITIAAGGLNPTSGSVFGGTSVTITGTNFATPVGVDFGGTAAASVTVNSSTSIVAVTPAHAAGAVDVTLSSTINGTATSVGGFTFTPSFAGPVQSGPISIDAAETILATANPENGSITVFNIAGNALSRVAEVPVGREPRSVAVTPDGKKAFVANCVDGTVSVVNLVTFNVSNTVDLSVMGEREPLAVLVSPNGTRVYVADSTSNRVAVINALTEAFITTVDVSTVGLHPRALAMTNDRDSDDTDELVYVSMFYAGLRPSHTGLDAGQDDQREGRVAVIDGTNTVTSTVILAPIVAGVAPTSGTGFPSNGSVLPLVGTVNGTGTTVGPVPANPAPNPLTFPTGCYPNQLAGVSINPTTNRIYVVSTGASPNGPIRFDSNVQGLVSVINAPPTFTELTGAGTLANVFNTAPLNMNQGVGNSTNLNKIFHSNPVAMAWRPDGTEAWVLIQNADVMVRLITDSGGIPSINAPTSPGGGPITEVDLQTATPQGNAPQGIVISSTNQAYVYNFVSRTVTQVNLTGTPAIVQTAQSASLPQPGSTAATQLLGEKLFYTGRGALSRNGWGACIVCHPDGKGDTVTWMFDGGPRKTIPLDGSFAKNVVGDQKILNYSSVRDEVQDFELNTRGVSGGLGLIRQDRQVALIAGVSGGVTSSAIAELDLGTTPSTLNTTSSQVSGNPALPSLPIALTDFATATLPDGRVLIIGGRDASGNVTNTTFGYDASTNSVTTLATLPVSPSVTVDVRRANLGAATVNTTSGVRVYAFGGYDPSGSIVSDTNEYNPATNTWRPLPAAFLPTTLGAGLARMGVAVAIGTNSANPQDIIFTVTGTVTGTFSTPVASAAVYRYIPDPGTQGSWADVTASVTLTARYDGGGAAILRGATRHVFAIGGFTAPGVPTNVVEEFNALTLAVVPGMTSLPTAIADFGIGVSNNTIVVAGGQDATATVTRSILVYSPAVNGPVAGGPGTPSGTWTFQSSQLAQPTLDVGVASPPPVFNLVPVGNSFRDPNQDAIAAWVATIRSNVALQSEPATGRTLFTQVGLTAPGVSCATCHGGAKWTRSRLDYVPSPSTNRATGQFQQIMGAELLFTIAQPGSIPAGNTFADAVETDVGTFRSLNINELRPNPADVSVRLAGLGGGLNGGPNGFNIPSLLSMHSQPPYFHNGIAETLTDLLNGVGGNNGPSPFRQVHTLTGPNQAIMLQFLRSIDERLLPEN